MKFPHPRRARLTAVVSAVLAATGGTPALAAAPGPATQPGPTTTAPAAPASGRSVPPGTRSVTLITGDVVTTRRTGNGGTVDTRRPDGTPSPVRVVESGADLFVYPQAVLPYLAAGTLDKRLFNVTGLIADGYDDAHVDQLPLIVSYDDAAAGLRTTTAPTGATRTRTLSSIKGAALSEDRHRADEFWAAITAGRSTARSTTTTGGSGRFGGGIAKIWLDGRVHADLADSTAQIGAPEVWTGGDTGAGVRVAVLDTGIDAGHPDLADRIVESRVFVPGEELTDRVGHGTHVASTIAGTGAASDGREKGVAPDARLAVGKVLSDQGYGLDSWILAGMEWAVRDAGATVVNMSLGSNQPSDGTDPISQAVNALSAETGALFVVSAGNNGAPGTVSAPGAADAALTVGAVDSADQLAYFSSQGPRTSDEAIKPELTAPGVGILAARSQYSPGEGFYERHDGTSMAAPHVAGAAALLAARHPDWTGQQLKDALVSTTRATPQYDAYQAGTGRVDVAAAVSAPIVATGTVFTTVAYDTARAGAVRHPVTFTNTTGQPITLDLTVDAATAPAGLFGLSAPRLTVPAYGTTAVTLTTDTSRAGAGRRYTGQLVAAGPDGTVLTRTAIGVGTFTPYHRLTLVLTDRAGKPAPGVIELGQPGSYGPDFVSTDPDGTAQLYLPQGVYSAMSFLNVTGSHGPNSLGLALLGDPDIDLRADTTVRLDGAAARRVRSQVPQPAADTFARLDYFRAQGDGLWRSFIEGGVFYDSFWAQPTSHDVTHGDFYVSARWRKEQPVLSVGTAKVDFDDVVRQQGTTQLPKGSWTLPAVYAGNGAASDYADLDARGKVVVVRHNWDVSDTTQAAAATAAGAKLMLVVNDYPWREVRDYRSDFFTPTPIEVALLSRDEGEALIAQIQQGRTRITVASQPVADYLYDLVQAYHNRIPAELTRTETTKTLARVDVGFTFPAGRARGGEFRFDWESYSNWGIGRTSNRPLAPVRTDWLSTGDLYLWGQEAYAEAGTYQIDTRAGYRAGSSGTEEFFEPIERPHLNNNFKLPVRSGDTLSLDVPGWGGADHVGMTLIGAVQTNELYQGDTLLGQSSSTWISGTAPAAGELPYRLVTRTSQDPTAGPYSTSTRTEWTFRSAAPAAGVESSVLPLLQLDYSVDTDAAGTAKGGTALTVSAAPLPGVAGAGIGPVTLETSYDDGAHWSTQSLDSSAGAWTANLRAPKGATHVSLRASAADGAGNSVVQTVIRAFGVR
ncbi:S8 family serine peptidase [Micromonospora mirobrigensis]|uniref:Serine protease, subtilisin family n=1 Tax=Micromonospora mirobrigensis TaxID=262898 RepID=A0A1C4XQM9_9ACTN|nr:S8 family serine peptidase [Micromonospora mirobrigensis]SCF10819.1 Serine protease, subtilisin family [Micromonospora mirobrigensis]